MSPLMKITLSVIFVLFFGFTACQLPADDLGVSAQIVNGESAEVAAMCAAITGIVATQVGDNSAELRFTDVKWWLQYTTAACVEAYKAELRIAANEDWDRVWPIIIEGDLECYNLKTRALDGLSE